jgi:uncharacterized protein
LTAPKLMKFLSIAGTAAMFLVGGAIVVHGIPALHHLLAGIEQWALALPSFAAAAKLLGGMLFEATVGILTGVLCLALFLLGKKVLKRS